MAQEIQPQPAMLGKPIQEISLPQFQGGTLSLSELKGKNVMLIFPRGQAAENYWCHICNYQYAEFLELEEKEGIRKKYDLEIVFVFPYHKAMLDNWIERFPQQIADIESWKTSEDANPQRKAFALSALPKSYTFEKGKVPVPFPILIDADQKVSNQLGLFRTEWGGRKIEQNVPTVMLIDKKGIVRFKYFSQNTVDRPAPEYLLAFIDTMMK